MLNQPSEFLSVAPLLPGGPDIVAGVDYFVNQLGFQVIYQYETGAGVRRGAVEFNLVQNDNREWADNCSVSIGVSDLQKLYQEYKGIDAIIGPLERKPWGRMEFHMIVPTGVCLQFYSASHSEDS